MQPATSSPESDRAPILVATRRVPYEDPVSVLHGLPEGLRFAWFGPGETLIGHGAAARLEATGPDRFHLIHDAAQALFARIELQEDVARPAPGPEWADAQVPAPRIVGGFSFQPEPGRSEPWEPFPAALFLLPERLWVYRDGACHLVEARRTDGEIVEPATPPEPTSAPPRAPEMTLEAWDEAVAEVLLRIRSHEMKKVVLARSRVLPPVDPVLLLSSFPDDPGIYRFLFEPVPGYAFVGASPEHLVTLSGDHIETVALAGTAPRGRSEAQDEAFAARLRASTKDNVEHALIVAWLDERLAAAGATGLRYGARRLRRLRHVQHLETLVLAKALPDTHVLRLVDCLHPTPAVGGLPVLEAYRLVRRLEPAPRGWYAGGIGVFDASGDGTFVTAIRSGVATRHGLHAYAGAGIVSGSDPAREWEETRWKFRPMEEAASRADPDLPEDG